MSERIELTGVAKFYGEVLGLVGVDLAIEPGLVAIVGPNGAGKTTLMNLIVGLLRPSRGQIRVRGVAADDAALGGIVGYCPAWDDLPPGATGRGLLRALLAMRGYTTAEVDQRCELALQRVGLTAAAGRRVAGYSKGMRQRIKLATALAHEPRVLVLDEPLNGLDPMARSELIGLFRDWASEGRHVLVSSHILHEVDMIADQIVFVDNGTIVAEGEIPQMREEVAPRHPVQVRLGTKSPDHLAASLFASGHVVEARVEGDAVLVRSDDGEALHRELGRLVVAGTVVLESLAPTDQDAMALYRYVVGNSGEEGT